ncbi:MAG: type II toxin-antitoxin system VapC family toxin, partial [bacterium]
VNLSEVVAKLADVSMDESMAREVLTPLGLDIVPFDQESAFIAGSLRPYTRHLGLSLGDRACLALGKRMGLPILTADRTWASLQLGIEIRSIR